MSDQACPSLALPRPDSARGLIVMAWTILRQSPNAFWPFALAVALCSAPVSWALHQLKGGGLFNVPTPDELESLCAYLIALCIPFLLQPAVFYAVLYERTHGHAPAWKAAIAWAKVKLLVNLGVMLLSEALFLGKFIHSPRWLGLLTSVPMICYARYFFIAPQIASMEDVGVIGSFRASAQRLDRALGWMAFRAMLLISTPVLLIYLLLSIKHLTLPLMLANGVTFALVDTLVLATQTAMYLHLGPQEPSKLSIL